MDPQTLKKVGSLNAANQFTNCPSSPAPENNFSFFDLVNDAADLAEDLEAFIAQAGAEVAWLDQTRIDDAVTELHVKTRTEELIKQSAIAIHTAAALKAAIRVANEDFSQ